MPLHMPGSAQVASGLGYLPSEPSYFGKELATATMVWVGGTQCGSDEFFRAEAVGIDAGDLGEALQG